MSHDFQLQAYPIVLMRPQVVPPFGWVGHIPFAYLAVELLKPSCLVELGTHSGNSYLAMCQAVSALDLPAQCFAVDTWQGDSHALQYGEQVYRALRARHDPRYGAFSQLLRMRFDEALAHFDDASVDLLHIDGLHTYDAVKQDFETWLPKLSDRAVVLMHDTAMQEREFGVGRFFDELSSRYPCFSFKHSHGLGIVAVGSHVPEAFTLFLRHAQSNPGMIRTFFEALSANLVDPQGRPQSAVRESEPVVCHLYHRSRGESFAEERMASLEVDAAQGVLDLRFSLPAGVRPDYLRLDPADFPGIYAVSKLQLTDGAKGAVSVEPLSGHLGHVQGELLPDVGSPGLRMACFDEDPYLEFEVGSALDGFAEGVAIEVLFRVEYTMVIRDGSAQRMLESQGMTGMRALSHARIDVQSASRDLSAKLERVEHSMVGEMSMRLERIEQSLAAGDPSLRLGSIEQAVDRLAKRNIWSWFKRER
jgi:hypothetical protein